MHCFVKKRNEQDRISMSLQEAISHGQFFPEVPEIGCGDITAGLAEAEHCLEGSMRLGGQKHFYMEANACIAIPKGEDGEMELWASTQDVNLTQMSAAKALGISANKITARVKRIGDDQISKHMHT